MNPQEFSTQLGRIQEQFGKNSFGTERAKLLWREVGVFEGRWLEKVVDSIISNSRASPTISDFSQFISEERDRRWKTEKEQHSKDANSFWSVSATDEERQLMLHTIRERVRGNIPDQDWKCFMDLLETRFPARGVARP